MVLALITRELKTSSTPTRTKLLLTIEYWIIQAVCEATGRKKDAVDEAYEKEGDLGEVAVQSRMNQKTLGFAAKPKPLHADYILEQFRAIAHIKGEKAQARKVEVIKGLMVNGFDVESSLSWIYLMRGNDECRCGVKEPRLSI